MDPARFREIRDQLNSDPKTKHYMLKCGDEWSWGDIDASDYPSIDEDLSDIEYKEVSPDRFIKGNLIGFIYINQNCPACLGLGKRSEEEKSALMYLWKVNHDSYKTENS